MVQYKAWNKHYPGDEKMHRATQQNKNRRGDNDNLIAKCTDNIIRVSYERYDKEKSNADMGKSQGCVPITWICWRSTSIASKRQIQRYVVTVALKRTWSVCYAKHICAWNLKGVLQVWHALSIITMIECSGLVSRIIVRYSMCQYMRSVSLPNER